MENKKNIGKILALDVGDKRIGLACSDALGLTVRPLGTINRRDSYTKLKKLIQVEKISKLLIGLPLLLDGSESLQTKKVKKFTAELETFLAQNQINLVVQLFDERLTTVAAEEYILGAGLKNEDRRKRLDEISACLLLESYLKQ
ncbi:Holliday junction resolvase RuvX [bacterium]|nr:Holliday junction resolvase RuvX [bacterium]